MHAHDADIEELWKLRSELESIKIAKSSQGREWRAAWRQRERWTPRWTREVDRRLTKARGEVPVTIIAGLGRASWGRGFLRKAKGQPTPDDVAAGLRAEMPQEQFVNGALAAYLLLSLDEGEDAGQHTLDSLGMNDTFAWAQAREFVGNAMAIRGSKILTKAYDTHVDTLAKLVLAKTNPQSPKTMRELTREIEREWTVLTRKQAERIARTESAFVWETTNWNALHLNQVETVDWLVAHGPSIGKSRAPVCPECLAFAAQSPHVLKEMTVIPPAHPFCSCTLVGNLADDWLPPAEPFTGSERKLEVFT